ncbi:unnamed protein product [Rotaria socialis]|uniref:G-protein coupled receptors family 1 profile domain-containing protein n=1 Tax=Rotaria socialis TaxID=392032 RepID=A0A817ZNQ9_9BILA|nr:unnamed protein product [Rotaria socialis]CAF3394755.1 unnamed protein product [Rotaria socialis]CAF4217530.1 unnamed protein product [Rotaria socialis]CAF4487354.1 unnamed protein product [Rotaria socialis]
MSSVNETLNYTNKSSIVYNEPISNAFKFWIYLIFLIPSISCSVFSLCYLLLHRTLRHALHNHAIIIFLFIGLIYEVTIYPWMLYYYRQKGIWRRTQFFCTLWVFIDWGLYFTQTILFAWATIERHIFIFHDRWVSTKKKRFLVHYLPLIILTLYCLTYYILVIFFPPCENSFNNFQKICVESCLTKHFSLYTYDTIVHQILPNLIIVAFSIGLLIRICWQKHRVGQSLQWRKHWKMTIQLLFVSIIYLIFSLPLTIVHFMDLCGVPRSVTLRFTQYAQFFNYCTILLCPIASIMTLPQLKENRSKFVRFITRKRTIAPMG